MPLISNKAKLIFQHIPKTGGASLKNAIKDYDIDSFNVGSYHGKITRNLKTEYPNYHTVTIVRNSYTSLVSMYRFTCIRYLKINPTYSGFKDWLYTKAKGLGITQQYAYCKDNNSIIIDEILRYDSLGNDIEILNLKLNINLQIDKHKQHHYGKYDWKSYYDDESKSYAYRLCKDDIDYFNWIF